MNATSKENGLDTKNNKIPQKLVPPALAIFKNKSDWPDNTFFKSSNKGTTCWFISHQDNVRCANGNSWNIAKTIKHKAPEATGGNKHCQYFFIDSPRLITQNKACRQASFVLSQLLLWCISNQCGYAKWILYRRYRENLSFLTASDHAFSDGEKRHCTHHPLSSSIHRW